MDELASATVAGEPAVAFEAIAGLRRLRSSQKPACAAFIFAGASAM